MLITLLLNGWGIPAQAGEDLRSSEHACVVRAAPIDVPFKSSPPNRGVKPDGFLSLASMETVHGVTVSKWQDDVNFFRIADCGGTFAYIRISAGANIFNEIAFSSLWPQARAAKLKVGAYHHLTGAPPALEARSPEAWTAEEVEAAFAAHGAKQAALFSATLGRLLREEQLNKEKTVETLAPVLAVAEGVSASLLKRLGPSKTSHRLVCTWIAEVEASPASQGKKVVLFSTPSIFRALDIGNAPCMASGNRVLWVGLPTVGGGSLEAELAKPLNVELRSMCSPDGRSNRCLVHQYTDRGGLALGGLSEGLSLSRFTGSPQMFEKQMRKGDR